jgi:hypothetical protein
VVIDASFQGDESEVEQQESNFPPTATVKVCLLMLSHHGADQPRAAVPEVPTGLRSFKGAVSLYHQIALRFILFRYHPLLEEDCA